MLPLLFIKKNVLKLLKLYTIEQYYPTPVLSHKSSTMSTETNETSSNPRGTTVRPLTSGEKKEAVAVWCVVIVITTIAIVLGLALTGAIKT
jgi:hypothetical protein